MDGIKIEILIYKMTSWLWSDDDDFIPKIQNGCEARKRQFSLPVQGIPLLWTQIINKNNAVD